MFRRGMAKKSKRNYIIAAILAVIIIAGAAYYFTLERVKVGDKVKIDYIGSIESGNIFDTSIKEVAEKNNISNKLRIYEPLEFTVGNKEVIKGIDEGIVGLTKGSKKVLIIQPENGYGDSLADKLIPIPRVREIDRVIKMNETLEILKEQFKLLFNKEPVLNEELENVNLAWPLEVIEINDLSVKLKNKPILGGNYVLGGTMWNSTFESKDGEELLFKQNPENGAVIEDTFGSLVITVNDDKIKAVSNPIIGKETQYGKIVNVTTDSIIIDTNHPLAGKILKFEITVIDIIKATSSLDNFAKCLTTSGAAVYTTFWCPHCKEQKELFGDSIKYVNVVECDPKGENAKPEECDKNNIKGYPTWIIGSEQFSGVQTLDKLAELTECKLSA